MRDQPVMHKFNIKRVYLFLLPRRVLNSVDSVYVIRGICHPVRGLHPNLGRAGQIQAPYLYVLHA